MLVATALERVFLFKDKDVELELADPHPEWSKEAVQNYYAVTYPILTTATIEGPEISNDRVEYKFVSTLGTKG